MKSKAIRLIPLCLLLLATTASAKFIVGQVIDAATGRPVPGAILTLGSEELQTDASGEFKLDFTGTGLLRVNGGDRFAPLALPVSISERLLIPLIPAETRLGEERVFLLPLFRQVAGLQLFTADTRWRVEWSQPPKVFLDPTLSAEQRRLAEEGLTLPKLPNLADQSFFGYTENELDADLLIRPVEGAEAESVIFSWSPQDGQPLGGMVLLGEEQGTLLQRTLLRLYGLHELPAEHPLRPYSILGDAKEFTRLDAQLLAIARRLSLGTDLAWYEAVRSEGEDRREKRIKLLALPFGVTYEDPFQSHVAALNLRRTMQAYSRGFVVKPHQSLQQLQKAAAADLPLPANLIYDHPFTLAEALQLTKEADCRYAFWGEFINRGETAYAAFYALDAETGELLESRETVLNDRLHYPRFLAEEGLKLSRLLSPPLELPAEYGDLSVNFSSPRSSAYVEVLTEDKLVAILHENDGETLLHLTPGRHKVELRYYLPLRHENLVIGIPVGERIFAVEIEEGRNTRLATRYAMAPTEAGRSWNYARVRITDNAGEILSEEVFDLASENEMWRILFKRVERLRAPEEFAE
ncbi:carboxypeptidase-like regulatory domain-containing protein [bacterium]|nr:carboxypeptidase-like regulatory domain-containing protein [bacterium]